MRTGSVCKFRAALAALSLAFLLLVGSFVGAKAVEAKTYRLASGEELIDPTLPQGWQAYKQAKGPAQQFKLSYILNADQRRQAIVNGQRVSEGDTVSGAKVERIQEGAVVLLVDGERQTLRLNKAGGIKKLTGE